MRFCRVHSPSSNGLNAWTRSLLILTRTRPRFWHTITRFLIVVCDPLLFDRPQAQRVSSVRRGFWGTPSVEASCLWQIVSSFICTPAISGQRPCSGVCIMPSMSLITPFWFSIIRISFSSMSPMRSAVYVAPSFGASTVPSKFSPFFGRDLLRTI